MTEGKNADDLRHWRTHYNADIFNVKRDKICVILRLLERTEMIRRWATKKHIVITLVKWSKFQIEATQSGNSPDTKQTREKK